MYQYAPNLVHILARYWVTSDILLDQLGWCKNASISLHPGATWCLLTWSTKCRQCPGALVWPLVQEYLIHPLGTHSTSAWCWYTATHGPAPSYQKYLIWKKSGKINFVTQLCYYFINSIMSWDLGGTSNYYPANFNFVQNALMNIIQNVRQTEQQENVFKISSSTLKNLGNNNYEERL